MASKIQYGSIWLANGGREAPRSLTINGRQTAQIAPLLRAETSAVYGRGNRTLEVRFQVTRKHATISAAQQFLWLHASSLPKSETALFHQQNGELIILPNAVAMIAEQSHLGVATRHAYTLVGSNAIITNPLPNPANDMILQTIPIPQGVSAFSVTGLALPIIPTNIGGFVRRPDNSPDLFATIVDTSITADGWDVSLSAQTPTAGYKYTYLIGL